MNEANAVRMMDALPDTLASTRAAAGTCTVCGDTATNGTRCERDS